MRTRVLAALVLSFALFAPGTPAVAAPGPTRAGPWTPTGWTSVASAHADQGLAVVETTSGDHRLTRGSSSVPDRLSDKGWVHIGDPSSAHGYVLDAYQGHATARAKLFVLTSPDGSTTHWVHRLVPGEQYNNSFTALTPDGRWFVAGEWGTMTRLLVFPTPKLNPAANSEDLRLAGTIRLDRPVRDVQGCAFAGAHELVCSTNDPGTDLFPVPRQLLSIDLHVASPAAAPSSTGRTAHVTVLGPVPTPSDCPVAPEVEGIDVHGNSMTVATVDSAWCGHRTYLFSYVRRTSMSEAATDRDARRQ